MLTTSQGASSPIKGEVPVFAPLARACRGAINRAPQREEAGTLRGPAQRRCGIPFRIPVPRLSQGRLRRDCGHERQVSLLSTRPSMLLTTKPRGRMTCAHASRASTGDWSAGSGGGHSTAQYRRQIGPSIDTQKRTRALTSHSIPRMVWIIHIISFQQYPPLSPCDPGTISLTSAGLLKTKGES